MGCDRESEGLRVELAIDVSTRGADVVLALNGDIDIHTAPHLRDRLASLQGEGNTSIVVDLGGGTFLDSSALGALLAAPRELTAAGGPPKPAAPPPPPRQGLPVPP